jgi:hypothetical protein
VTAPDARRAQSEQAEQTWTMDKVKALGMTTDLETAATILGIGRTLAFELAKTNQFPIRILRLGRRTRISVPELIAYLTGDEKPT